MRFDHFAAAMAAAYNLSPLAYLKIILHAAKYPSSTCVGLLLGQVEGTNVHIVDAIPLLHHWSELSPMMEAGLIMVSFILPYSQPQV